MSIDPAELIGKVAALDPTLQTRILALANEALDQAEFLIHHGDPKMKQALIRNFLQVFSKYLDAKQANDEIEELRKSLKELREAFMSRTPGGVPLEVATDAGMDTP